MGVEAWAVRGQSSQIDFELMEICHLKESLAGCRRRRPGQSCIVSVPYVVGLHRFVASSVKFSP
jgi:hypothetical protein